MLIPYALLDLDPGQGSIVNLVKHGRYGTTGSLMLFSEPGSDRPYNKNELPALTKQSQGQRDKRQESGVSYPQHSGYPNNEIMPFERLRKKVFN